MRLVIAAVVAALSCPPPPRRRPRSASGASRRMGIRASGTTCRPSVDGLRACPAAATCQDDRRPRAAARPGETAAGTVFEADIFGVHATQPGVDRARRLDARRRRMRGDARARRDADAGRGRVVRRLGRRRQPTLARSCAATEGGDDCRLRRPAAARRARRAATRSRSTRAAATNDHVGLAPADGAGVPRCRRARATVSVSARRRTDRHDRAADAPPIPAPRLPARARSRRRPRRRRPRRPKVTLRKRVAARRQAPHGRLDHLRAHAAACG